MSYRSRCCSCGFVFPKVTRSKRCPKCKAFGWITTFKIYKLEDCPLCSNLYGGTTQHLTNEGNCPLCDSNIAIVRECIFSDSYSSYSLDIDCYNKRLEEQ